MSERPNFHGQQPPQNYFPPPHDPYSAPVSAAAYGQYVEARRPSKFSIAAAICFALIASLIVIGMLLAFLLWISLGVPKLASGEGMAYVVIMALVLFIIFIFDGICSLIGTVLGAVAVKNKEKRGVLWLVPNGIVLVITGVISLFWFSSFITLYIHWP